jgi:hypothetical protein
VLGCLVLCRRGCVICCLIIGHSACLPRPRSCWWHLLSQPILRSLAAYDQDLGSTPDVSPTPSTGLPWTAPYCGEPQPRLQARQLTAVGVVREGERTSQGGGQFIRQGDASGASSS